MKQKIMIHISIFFYNNFARLVFNIKEISIYSDIFKNKKRNVSEEKMPWINHCKKKNGMEGQKDRQSNVTLNPHVTFLECRKKNRS